MNNPNYWLVGASWDGTEHQDKIFVENGYWMLGYSKEQDPVQFAKAKQIKIGDRIAIKRLKGAGSPDIRILHIGIVKGVVQHGKHAMCIVDWFATDLDKSVASHGCLKSIHGPYEANDYDGWIQEIFSL